ncbi:MAG: DUF370 domain-containing protein [bacterium]|nr:DUF370 domain-containing protein [bacterium]
MSAGLFVYLGGDTVVDLREVVAILDARGLRRSSEGRNLLARAAAAGRLVEPGLLPSARAIVVTAARLYPTPVAPATVAGRIGKMAGSRRRKTAQR